MSNKGLPHKLSMITSDKVYENLIIPVAPMSKWGISKTLIKNDALRNSVLAFKAQKKKGKRLESKYTKEATERAARMYKTNAQAARALMGHSGGSSFKKLCERYGIETPAQRKKREKSEGAPT